MTNTPLVTPREMAILLRIARKANVLRCKARALMAVSADSSIATGRFRYLLASALLNPAHA